MASGTALDLLATKDGGDFDESFRVVVRVEEGEPTGEEAEKHDPGGPDVERCVVVAR